MPVPRRTVTITTCLVVVIAAAASAQSIRDRIRLSPEKRTPITEQQATELTLTLNDAAVRPIQVWLRTAGTIDGAQRTIAAALSAEANLPAQRALDQKDKEKIEAGRKLIENEDNCVQCHKFHAKGELGSAPDLTGYGSREWLIGMISNPAHERTRAFLSQILDH